MHCNARLTSFSRELLIKRYEAGERVTEVSRQLGVSRKCCYFWLRRYQAEGRGGLADRRSGPKTSPRRISPKTELKVLKMRDRRKEGPDRLAIRLGMPRSTVYQVLKRHGQNHLFEKHPKEKDRRYEKKEPGSLQVDLKQIPALGGKRYRYQVSIIDDCTRYAKAEIFEKKTTANITAFLARFLDGFPFEVKEVATDNGWEFTLRYTRHKEKKTLFEKELAQRGIKHRLIQPRHPQSNGKVERFHRTVDEELYRVKRFINEEHRKRELKKYLERYNSKRIHLGIDGMTPEQKLNIFLREKCYQVA